MRIKYQYRAIEDLERIYNYISQDNAKAAKRVIDKITYSIKYLEMYPLLGRAGRIEKTRELVVAGTNFVVIYTLPDKYYVSIETVIHGSQKFPG